ncbi:MAG: hypothetical protein ACREIA_22380 [Opitutaceae bacterium]
MLAALLLLGSGTSLLDMDGLELGDGAVNSLAIRDALDWNRIHGNYSRWGFFHPGPVFFYWQAGWEWLLCDLTGLATTPMGAHHLAIVILNAALLAVGLVLLRPETRVAIFVPLACAAAAVHFSMVNRVIVSGALLSAWPPHVLLMPFALFTIACGVLAAGSLTALPWVIASGSLLVHGHAAHGLFVLPMFAVATGLWGWKTRRLPWKMPGDRASTLIALVVLLIFLFPLVIDIFAGSESNLLAIWQQLHVPSEDRRTWFKAMLYLFSYYGYIPDQENVIQTLSDETKAAFWSAAPALAIWAIVHLGLIAFWFWRRRDPATQVVRSGIVMVFVAGALSLIWGKIQMGRLENFNAFYVHGLSLVAGWLALRIIVERIPGSLWISSAAWCVFAVSVWLCRPWLSRGLEAEPALRETVEKLAATRAPREGSLILSFEHQDWPAAAGLVVGLDRAGVDVRVGEEWMFMFGRPHVLHASEEPDAVWFIQSNDAPGTVAAFYEGLGIRDEAAELALGVNELGVGARSFQPFAVVGLGIAGSDEEVPGQAVTVSHVARLRFHLSAEARKVEATLRVRPQPNPPTDEIQSAFIFWEGEKVAEARVDDATEIAFSVAASSAPADRAVDLRIETPNAWQPRALGVSGDSRYFALILNEIVLRVEGDGT